jgi:hypothetical protein
MVGAEQPGRGCVPVAAVPVLEDAVYPGAAAQIGGSRSLLRYLGQAALQILGVQHWEELDFRLELLE